MSELDAWYRYAAGADGFIGAALRTHRSREFMTQEQQRNALGILGEKYDELWLRLQAMPLPRRDERFASDIAQIVAAIVSELGVDASVDQGCLGELVRAGLS
jgi:hypothetical protein